MCWWNNLTSSYVAYSTQIVKALESTACVVNTTTPPTKLHKVVSGAGQAATLVPYTVARTVLLCPHPDAVYCEMELQPDRPHQVM
jgi:hypothetical protein